MAVVFGGLTLALALGVPAGTLLGGAIGYRWVFGLVAVVCLVMAGAVLGRLPRLAAPPVVGLRERLAVGADRRVLTLMAITVLGVVAAMSIYIYVVPLLTATAGLDAPTIGLLLSAYGVGAILGNSWGGRAADRFGTLRTLYAVTVASTALIAALPLTATSAVGAGLTLFVWGVVTWAFNPPMQSLLLELAPAGGLVLSLNASAIYVGFALAGVLGGVVIDTVGVLVLPVLGAGPAALSLVLLIALRGSQRAAARTPSSRPG